MSPFTMAGWTESVAGAVAQQAITGIPDEHMRVEGNNIVVPGLNELIGYYAIGVDAQNAQLASPELRRIALLDIAPVEVTALPVFPPDFPNRAENPLPLISDEQLTAHIGNSNVGAQQESILILLSSGAVSPISGEIITVEATATAPASAYVWANAPLAFAQVLPKGTYDIVGCRCEQANTIAFRFVVIGDSWRPGHLAVGTISAKDHTLSRYGKLGKWSNFEHLRPPTVDFFGDGTGGAAILYLDLIKRT